MGCEENAGDKRIRVDAEAAANDGGGASGKGDGVRDTGEERAGLFVEASAFGGEGEGASGTVEEADADAGFEAGNSSTDGWLGDSKGLCGAVEAAGFDDCDENADAAEEAIVWSVERHLFVPLVMIVFLFMHE